MNKKLKKGEHMWVGKNNIYISYTSTIRDHPKIINVANKRGQ